jgi:omega-6 fatty acid desaturase (delta-12 desaturase)
MEVLLIMIDFQSAIKSTDLKTALILYRGSVLQKSIWQLLSSVLPLFFLWVIMWFSLQYSYILTLALAVPTAGFMLRTFMIQHDCGHGSFFESQYMNDITGFLLGVLTLTPYHHWKKSHSLHHATSGNLDRRGYGDIKVLTVNEYLALSPLRKLMYRLFRNPFFLFGVGPIFYFAVIQRFPYYSSPSWKKERQGVYWTNLLIFAIVWLLSSCIGLREFLLIELPVVAIGSSAGVWLVFVQHHFQGTYWRRHENWDYFVAGLAGSSYYELPKLLQWFTANIGFHHIHHLDSKIPNYRLEECFEQNPILQKVKRLTFFESLSCPSLKLWNESEAKMISFRDLAS